MAENSVEELMNLLIGLGIWLVIALFAVINGVLREQVLVRLAGEKLALPLSGITLSLIIFIVTLYMLHLVRFSTLGGFIGLGFFWLCITLIFEYSMGYFLEKKPIREISRVFNIRKGNLFILALLVAALAPAIVAKLKGYY